MQEILTASAEMVGTAWEETEDKVRCSHATALLLLLTLPASLRSSLSQAALLSRSWLRRCASPALWLARRAARSSPICSQGVLKGIDSLPVLPAFFELVGIYVSAWLTYRFLLFKDDREELRGILRDLKERILQ